MRRRRSRICNRNHTRKLQDIQADYADKVAGIRADGLEALADA